MGSNRVSASSNQEVVTGSTTGNAIPSLPYSANASAGQISSRRFGHHCHRRYLHTRLSISLSRAEHCPRLHNPPEGQDLYKGNLLGLVNNVTSNEEPSLQHSRLRNRLVDHRGHPSCKAIRQQGTLRGPTPFNRRSVAQVMQRIHLEYDPARQMNHL